MASYSQLIKAGALIKLPITYTDRNVFTKLDDHGYYASLERIEGESIANFKARMASVYTRPTNTTEYGLTDAIARELNLGHEPLIAVTTSRDVRLTVSPEYIEVSGLGYDTSKVDIIDVDIDGYWVLPNIGTVVSGLNTISGIVATSTSAIATMPAMLLEPQSSYITEYRERVPPSTSFRLGYYKYGQEVAGTVLSGTVSFTDTIAFATEVSGTPQSAGEWSLDQNINTIRVFNIPTTAVDVIYTYSVLQSGMTMNLIGNGVKVMNLMLSEVQHMLFQNSGIGATARGIVDELRMVDGAFWGK